MKVSRSRYGLRLLACGIPRRSQSHRSPFPLVALIGTIAVLATVAGAIFGGRLAAYGLLLYVRHVSGLRISVQSLTASSGGYVASGLTASSRDGAVFTSAPRARIAFSDGVATLQLDRPRIVVSPLRLRTGDMEDARGRLGTVRVIIRDGTLVVTRAPLPEPFATFEDFELDARFTPGSDAQYDARLQFVDGADRYPVSGHAALGRTVWTATELPLAAFSELLPEAPLTVSGGIVRDLWFERGAAIDAAGRLQNVSAFFEGHALRGVHGILRIAASGIGSPLLAGTMDAVPFSVAGEVHDLPAAWARTGSPDLDALGKVIAKVAAEPRLQWMEAEATAPGLTFGQYGMQTDHGPLAVSLLAINPEERTLSFDTAIAGDHTTSGGERTSSMAIRTGAVAGVNGDYFDIGGTYEPQGMLVRHGELIRGPTDRASLVIDRDNRVTFAEFRLDGELRTLRGVMPVTEVNDWPPGDVCVITPAFGSTLPATVGRTFVGLEPLGNRHPTQFRVTQVVAMNEPMTPRFGVTIGPLVKIPLPHEGEIVDLRYALVPHVDDAIAGIGGGPILLRHGRWYEDPVAPAPDERNHRWPVVALATTREGSLMLVAVDGRHPERSVGMTRPEFARLLLRLGGVDAMALDSGGSVTLVSRKPGDWSASVRNVPSDSSAERWISDALLLYSTAPSPSIVPPARAATPVLHVRPTQ